MERIFRTLMACCALAATLLGQTTQDPLGGARKFGGGSPGVVLMTRGANDSCVLRVQAITENLSLAPQISWGSNGNMALGFSNEADMATGDVDGDGFDEIAAVWEGPDRQLKLIVSPMNVLMTAFPVMLSYCDSTTTGLTLTHYDANYLLWNTHVALGNFDSDPQKEILVAYWGSSGNIMLKVYKARKHAPTGDLVLELLAADSSAYLDYWLRESARFDITAGDFDGDGRDEILLVSVESIITNVWGVYARLFALEGSALQPRGKLGQVVTANNTSADFGAAACQMFDKLAVTSGDLDGDGRDEGILGVQRRVSYWTLDLFHVNFVVEGHLSLIAVKASPDLVTLTATVQTVADYGPDQKREALLPGFPGWEHLRMPPMCVAAGDLDRDGKDEVIWGRWHEAVICQMGPGGMLAHTFIQAWPCWAADVGQRTIVIADIDTVGSAESRPEILLADRGNGCQISMYRVGFDGTGNVNGLAPISSMTNMSFSNPVGIAVGDFDGKSFSLGTPSVYTRPQFVYPSVIINGPPSHFDIIQGVTYDIPGVYTAGVPDFWVDYNRANNQTQTMQSRLTSDWGISASLSGEVSYFGMGIKAGLSMKYGEQFSKDTTLRRSVNISQTKKTWMDDAIFILKTDYDLWEYPIFNALGQIQTDKLLVVRPKEPEKGWYAGKQEDATFYTPNHEVGNILSYVQYDSLQHNPDVGESVAIGDFATVGIAGTSYEWRIEQSTFGSGASSTTKQFGIGVSASVSGWGIEVGVEGTYNGSEITTLESSVLSLFSVGLSIGSYNLPGFTYRVTPYVFWSRSGALVLDYSVMPDTTATGGYPSFWKEKYGAKSDPAFALPWRYEPEKGNPMPDYLRYRTREISFNPPSPKMGDTVQITARIHNYSLVATPSPVELSFYLGDPGNGGTLLHSRDGQTKFSTAGPISPRGLSVLSMSWVVPTSITSNPRIYATIDPDNKIDQVHTTNNTGFAVLPLVGSVDVGPAPESDLPTTFGLFENYPNPFNPVTRIRYQIPEATLVRLAVYDILGREVAVLVNERKAPGFYEVEFDARGVASGVYLYRLAAESPSLGSGSQAKSSSFLQTRKMVVVK